MLFRSRRHLAAVVTLVSAAAATSPLAAHAQDTPRAPALQGLGTLHMPVSTGDREAQAFFDQGLRLLYAFNHAEARRAFQEAARRDPSLAMAHWGEAMTLAVNLNAPMPAAQGREAHAAAQRAVTLAGRASARERALVDALAMRFSADGAAPRPPLDRAYADAMGRAAAAFPGDPDVQVLFADARMNTMAWDYWTKDGALKPNAEPIREALERTIEAFPDHPGAHHYYIHLMEGTSRPEAAERSADRLGALMPAAGHMVHMPAHIYLRVGRYADAAEANVRAIAADEDYLAQCQAQGLYPVSYYPHNLHFLWAAATFEGRSAVAIDAAQQVAAKVPHHHAGALAWTTDFPVTPWLAYVRFGRWQKMLTEPAPPAHEPYATGIWRYGRALSFLARGDRTRAQQELAALDAVTRHEAFTTTLKDLPLLTNLRIALKTVEGEMAARAGQHTAAVAALREAVAIEDALPYSEPPIWHQPARQVLGALLLQAGLPAEAEATYREDLGTFRENGWSLFGLWQSLEAQRRHDEARAVRARFDRAWSRADIALTSSRVMPDSAPASSAAAAPAAKPAPTAGALVERVVTLSTGVRMEYVERGDATGPPVVFLHGVTDSWRSFERVLQRLPAGVRAFAISARGHGDSSRPSSGYLYADMAADLRAFLDAMRIREAVIAGHSMGGLVAQRFAVDQPQRVAGLVLMGTFDTLFHDAAIEDFYRSSIAPLTDPIGRVFAREWQQSTLARPMDPAHLDTVVDETLKVPARVWRDTIRGFLDTPDFSAALAAVHVPTLLAWGDKDTYATRAAQDRLLALIPGARLRVYEGGGHAFHWEDPESFVADLLRALPAAAPSSAAAR